MKKIVSASSQDGRGPYPPVLILVIEKTIPFRSRIRK
jgi:hypothetical protein